jgi:ribosomal protein S12 methylthiotransferase accessory factor
MTSLVRASLTLVHDGNCQPLVHEIRAVATSGLSEVDFAAASRLCPPGRLVLIMFDGTRIAQAIGIQDLVRRRGGATLMLQLRRSSITLGPLVHPHRAGCIACCNTWTENNRRGGASGALGQVNSASPVVDCQAPLAPGARSIFRSILGHAVSEGTLDEWSCGVTRLQWNSLLTTRHRFVPHPSCPHCSTLPPDSAELAVIGFEPRMKANVEDARIANRRLDVRELRRQFVDQRMGLIKHVFHDISSTLMPMYGAEMPIMGADAVEVGYGRAESREKSELVAMLEVLERFAGHSPRRTVTQVRGSYSAISQRFPTQSVDPREFILHAPHQLDEPGFGLEPYDDALEFDWCWGYSLRRRTPVLVPQQLAYYWLDDSSERPVNRFVYDSSSGCAMGGCIEEATLYGLLEVLERDAYLTSWFGQLTPRVIALDAIDNRQIRALVARSRAQGYELHAFDMRLDIDIPLVLAMIVDPAADAPVKSYCASAAHLHWEHAIFSALVEVSTSMGVYQHIMPANREQAYALYRDPARVQKMADHVLLYSLPETYDWLGFLHGGEASRPATPPQTKDLTQDLERTLAATLRVAKDVIVVNQTFSEMRTLGLHCVKVIAPGLTPVTFGHQHRRISLERINGAAIARGHGTITAQQLNPRPHNFP